MKILLINKFYFQKGGSETYVFLLKNLLEQAGHEVAVFSMNDPRNEKTAWSRYGAENKNLSSAEVFTRPRNFFKLFASLFSSLYSFESRQKLFDLISDFQPDIAHVHNVSYYLTSSVFDVLRRTKTPSVVTLHDYQYVSPAYLLTGKDGIFEKSLGKNFFSAVRARAVQNSMIVSFFAAAESALVKFRKTYERSIDLAIAPSRFVQAKYAQAGWRVPTAFLPHPLDLSLFHSSQAIRSGVVFVGRVIRDKGVKTLCEAAEKLPEIPFIIFGEGDLKDELMKNTPSNVTWMGHRPPHEVRDLLSRARLCVIPSEYYENAPFTALEALALGVPIVASRLGGLTELVREERTGKFFDPFSSESLAQSIKAVYENPNIAEMKKHCREFAERYADPQKHADQLMVFYQQVIQKKKNLRADTHASSENRYQSGAYLEKNPTWHAEDSEWKAEQIKKLLMPLLTKKFLSAKKLSVVDYGCGTGGVLRHMQKKFSETSWPIAYGMGIDVSDEVLALARSAWPTLEFSRSIDETAQVFDFGMLIDVIEHVKEFSPLISGLTERCEYLILHIPLDDSFNNRMRNKFSELEKTLGHIHYFHPDSAFELLKKENLEVLDFAYTRSFLIAPEKTIMNRLIFLPRLFGSFFFPKQTARWLGGLSLLVLTKKKESS